MAIDLTESKLMGQWPAGVDPSNSFQGSSAAISDKWILVGANGADSGALLDVGAVQVFNAFTGRWTRRLSPPVPQENNENFGAQLAISGDLGVIGAPGLNLGIGAVFVYNLRTGRLVRTIQRVGTAQFGSAVAVAGGKILIGAPGDSNDGRAYLYDLASGAELATLAGFPAPGVGATFGQSVAIDGNIGIVGAPLQSLERGGAYVFDLTTFAQIDSIVPAASVNGDRVGWSVGISRGVALMAAPYRDASRGSIFTKDLRSGIQAELVIGGAIPNSFLGSGYFHNGIATSGDGFLATSGDTLEPGSAYFFDLSTGGLMLRRLQASDGRVSRFFGSSVALWGGNAVVGCVNDTLPSQPAVGSAYLFRTLMTNSPMLKVAAKPDFAPGTVASNFGALGDAYINSNGRVAFGSQLVGPSSHRGRDNGVWTTIYSPHTLRLAAMSSTLFGTREVASVGRPIINQQTSAIYPVTFKAGVGGVTALNNQAIVADQPGLGTAFVAAQTNGTFTPFGVAKVQSFGELVQTNQDGTDQFAVACTLRKDPATFTDPTNDTGVLIHQLGGGDDGVREGAIYPPDGAVNYGQFTGRVSYHYGSILVSAALTGPVANNAVIVRKAFSNPEAEIARKGQLAPELAGPIFSSFVGESASANQTVLYRAMLSGGGSTRADNEGLWRRTLAPVDALALRKGFPHLGLPTGVTIARFINHWIAKNVNVLALVQLRGTGVNAANDQALLMVQEDGSLTILMREGDGAPGCQSATIGTINRVEVDSYDGAYAVLATLSGAPASANQALFCGQAVNVGNPTSLVTLRRPILYLRKGQLFENQPSPVRSISLPVTNITPGGFGGTGRGRAISWNGYFTVTVEFANGIRQIMRGSVN